MVIRDNFCLFGIKTYVVTLHLNRLEETVQMRGNNMVQVRNKRKYLKSIIKQLWLQSVSYFTNLETLLNKEFSDFVSIKFEFRLVLARQNNIENIWYKNMQ